MTKKRNLLFVSLFLVFGLAAMAPSALAQNVFTVANNTNNDARAEGLAEAVGTITLTTVSTGTINTTSKFIITYTQPITSVDTILVQCSGLLASTLCSGFVLPVTSSNLSNGNKTLTLPFRTTVNLAGNTAPGTAVSITVRCNVTALYPGGGTVLATVTASYISGTPLTLNNSPTGTTWTVAIVQPEPALSVGFGGFYKTALGEANVLICLGVIKKNKDYEDKFVVNVDEEFTYALTSESYEYFLDPGASYVSSDGVTVIGDTDVTNGTVISVTITGIPVGLGIDAEDPIPCSLYTSLPMYCNWGGPHLEVTFDAADSSPNPVWGSATVNSATFEYVVTSIDNGTNPENINLPFKIETHGPLGTSGLPQVYVLVSKQPQSPPNTKDIPRFNVVYENKAPGLSVVGFTDCSSYLLYPFAGEIGAWDTLFGVANTTMDPLGGNADPLVARGSAVPQTGTCTFWYYTGGTGYAWTSAPLGPGTFNGWDFSSTAWTPAVPPSGSLGYIFAICNFSNAWGYADIVVNYGSPVGLLGNYIAIVIPNPAALDRATNGAGMGEGATVSPTLLKSLLIKVLNGKYPW